MKKYYTQHIRKLRDDLEHRYTNLLKTLPTPSQSTVEIDFYEVRLAVADLISMLNIVKKLK